MILRLMVVLAATAMCLACGDDDDTGDTGGVGTDDTTTTTTTGDDATGDATTDAGAELPNSCAETADCDSGDACIDNVCVLEPEQDARLLDNTVDDDVAGSPNLECKNGLITAPTEGPDKATIHGIVDRFGSGRKTIDIQVSVFLQEDWPPEECTSLPFDEQHECFRNVAPKDGWSTVSTDPEAGAPEVPPQCQAHKDCPPGYECQLVDVEKICSPQFGVYELKDVPTNTWLVIRSRNDESQPLYESKWKDTYISAIYLYSDRVDGDGRYNTNALMVSSGQWKTIPNTLLVGSIKKGNGAVGGRLRDCRTPDRDSFTIGWGTVDLMDPGTAIAYFNDDEEDTVPLVDRIGTDKFGRFAIVDVPPGQNTVSAAGLIDGKVTSMGSELVYVVPDSLSVVSFPGKQAILKK